MNYLYHGSPYKLDVIEPRLSPCDKEPLVYASNQYEFALFYAGNDTNDLEINQSYYNGVYTLTEILPGMFRKVLDRDGYVYCFDKEGFRQTDTHIFVSSEPAVPVQTVYIPNVLDELKKQNTEFYIFPSLPPFISDRISYAKQRCALFGMDYLEWRRKYYKALQGYYKRLFDLPKK